MQTFLLDSSIVNGYSMIDFGFLFLLRARCDVLLVLEFPLWVWVRLAPGFNEIRPLHNTQLLDKVACPRGSYITFFRFLFSRR